VLKEFADRLTLREKELMDALEVAHRRLMSESVRNAIVSTCRQLELWPPRPAPAGVEDDDCAFEDTLAPLPVIALRAYHEEVRRSKEEALHNLSKRANTASFILDFASDVGVDLPQSELHQQMLNEFMSRVEEWVRGQEDQAGPSSLGARARKAILAALGAYGAAGGLREQAKVRWSKNWESTGGTFLNIAMVGLAMAAGAATVHRTIARGRK